MANRRRYFVKWLRSLAEMWQRGELNREDAIADMVMALNTYEEQSLALRPKLRGVTAPRKAPVLKLSQPLSPRDQVLSELYAEAVAFWSIGYGKLTLIK